MSKRCIKVTLNISIHETLLQLVLLSVDAKNILISTHTPYIGIILVYILRLELDNRQFPL
jgi:hypothetical protein